MAELSYSPAASGKRSMKKMPVRVDLTAMVDLAFLLITFFMLTTSLIKPRSMPVVMPTGPAGAVPESRSMTICLGKNNQVLYYLGLPDKPIAGPMVTSSGEGIRGAIMKTAKKVFEATGKNMNVLLKPDKNSIYASLVDALDELNITGVRTYAIADISAKDVDLLKQKGIY